MKAQQPQNQETREQSPEKLGYDTPQLSRVGSVVKLTQGPTSGFEDGFGSGSGSI